MQPAPVAPAPAAPPVHPSTVLSADPDDYMSAEQLEYFRQRLCDERDALLRAAQDTTEHLHEFEYTPDPSDRATMEEDHSLELRVRDRERRQLHRIDGALMRIRDGSYGWCEDTGEPIGLARLLARPTATLSLEAQERHERVRKMQGR